MHSARENVTPANSRANSVKTGRNRNGSAETNVDHFGRPLERPPQTPRCRLSPGNDRHSLSRERERRDWRDDPPGDAPTGFGSRLLVMENHLREIVGEAEKLKDEMVNHRDLDLTVKSMSKTLKDIQRAKISLEGKLDGVFAEWNSRIGNLEKNSTSNFADVAVRITKLENDIKRWLQQSNSNSATATGNPTANVPTFNIGSPLSAPLPFDPWAKAASGFSSAAASTAPPGFGPTPAPTPPPPQSSFGQQPPPASSAAPTNGWAPRPSGPSGVPPTPNSWAPSGAGTNLMPWNDKHWTVDNKPRKSCAHSTASSNTITNGDCAFGTTSLPRTCTIRTSSI